MATDTLLDYVTANEKALTDENGRAQANLTTFQQALATAQNDLATHTQNVTKLQQDIAAIRQKIAVTTNPADGKELFDELSAKTTEIRGEQAQITAAADAVAQATSWIATAQDELDRTAALKQQATAAKVEIAAADTERTSWKNVATSPALARLPAAADVVAGDAKTHADDARNRLDGARGGDIPGKLFARAEERWKREKAREDAVEQAVAEAEDTEAGLASPPDGTKLAFERSEAAIRDFALGAQSDYQRALVLLDRVTDAPALNQAKKDEIDAAWAELEANATSENGAGGAQQGAPTPPEPGGEVEAAPAGEGEPAPAPAKKDAIDKQKARDDQQATIDSKQQALDAAILNALADDPAKDPETNDAVVTARANLKTEQDKLPPLEKAYQAAKADLDKLEAAIPDDTWARFEDYEEALATLADLHGIDPDALKRNLVDTEQAYAQALASQRQNERRALAVGEEVRRREDRLTAIAASVRARLIAALRGDG